LIGAYVGLRNARRWVLHIAKRRVVADRGVVVECGRNIVRGWKYCYGAYLYSS